MFWLSVNFLCELSVFTFEEAILANLEGKKFQYFPGPYDPSNHGGTSLDTRGPP